MAKKEFIASAYDVTVEISREEPEEIVISGGTQKIIGPSGSQIWPVVMAMAAEAVLSADAVQAYTLDMLYAALNEVNEGEQLKSGPCKNAFKVTCTKGTIYVVDSKNQPGSYNYLLPNNGVPREGSADEQLMNLAAEDKAAGIVLPFKDVLSLELFTRIFDGSEEMTAVRESLGRWWYLMKTAPSDHNARFCYSVDGSQGNSIRVNSATLRCARSVPPSP